MELTTFKQGFTIRNPREEDANRLAQVNFVLELLYRYHGDFEPANMFCAVDEEGELLAVAHLMPHDTFDAVGHDGDARFIRYLDFEIAFAEGRETEAVKDALTEALIGRAREIKARYPEKRIVMAQYIDTDQTDELSYWLSRGFAVYDTIVVFKYDLEPALPQVSLPEGVRIERYALNHPEAQAKYREAELAAFDGVAWSLNHLGWMQGSPEMTSFCAFSGDRLIGSTSTWRITDERSATENIFVVPEWRGRGIASALIHTALGHLKAEGKRIATLGTHGTNRRAIALYTRLGYELYGFRQTIGYEVDGEPSGRRDACR